ncbi:MAG TPA: TraR/DksA family transcriptional regulator [Myxococcales bacterium]|jgi:DnaK suppressor protein|nr:TraR/DksA family transcriptional regulator [Myxococcales bacterium]
MNEIAKEARKRLLDRRRVIEGMIGEVERNESALQNGTHSDVLDRAAHREPIAVLESLRGVHHGELAELDAALSRIEHGSYGTCQGCGRAVGRQRLRAIPEARFCIECVSTQVRGARRAPAGS